MLLRVCDCRKPDGSPRLFGSHLVRDGETVWACRQCFGVLVPDYWSRVHGQEKK